MIFEMPTLASLENWRFFPLLLFSCLAITWNFKRRRNAINILSTLKTRNYVLSGYSPLRQIIKLFLFMAGSLLLFIAFLRPQWGKIEENIEQEGRDLLIALDVSRSMLASDLKPNRLEYAKNKIKLLLQRLQCERIGLMLFSGEPLIQCPLTTDYAVFSLFLDAIDAQTISNGTTAIDRALAKAVQVFENMPNRKTKLLVIFTDGEDFSSNLSEIKKKAAEIGLHIFTIGIGTTQGAPVPVITNEGRLIGHEKDAKGAVVISQLNEGILKTLAHDSGGRYFTACNNGEEINELVSCVERFEKEQFDTTRMPQLQERYPLFAAASFTCLLLEWLL